MSVNLSSPLPPRRTKRPARLGMLFSRLLFVLVIAALVAPYPAASRAAAPEPAGPAPSWTIDSVDAPRYFLNMTDRSFGFRRFSSQPCVAYGGDGLYYSCYDAGTAKWETENVDDGFLVGQYAALAYDQGIIGSARAYIAYYDANNAQLKLAWRESKDNWHFIPVDDVVNLTPKGEAVIPAIEEPGVYDDSKPVYDPTVYTADSETLAPADPSSAAPSPSEAMRSLVNPWMAPAAQSAAPAWLEETDKMGYGKYPSIAIDINNRIHISYYDELHGTLEYEYYDGFQWAGKKVLDKYNDLGDVGLWTSIAVDNLYNVYISYMSEKYDDLKFAYRPASGGWEISTIDSAANVGTFTSVAIETKKLSKTNYVYLPHISYYDFADDNLKHAYKDSNGVWHVQAVDSTGWTGWYSSIAIDAANVIYIAYYRASSGDLRVAIGKDGSWTLRTLDNVGVYADNQKGRFTSIGVYDGLVGITYMDTALGALKYVYRSNSWKAPQIIYSPSRDVGVSTSLVMSPTGVPHISYMDATAGYLKWARPEAAGWRKTVIQTYPYAGYYSSIDLNAFGNPRVAYYDQVYDDASYAYYNSWNWSPRIDVDSTGDVGQYISMKIDTTGKPHFAYYDVTHQNLVYATRNLAINDWFTQTVDGQAEDVGWYTDLALTSDDVPYVSYYDFEHGTLKVARQSPITLGWLDRTVDTIGLLPKAGVGAYSSIAVDSLGHPHVTYYDITNQNLMYATFNANWDGNGDWDRVVIDAPGDVGRFSSLAVDDNDNKHVCYYDYTNGDLKYARYIGAGPSWEVFTVDGDAALGLPARDGDVGAYCDIAVRIVGGDTYIGISYYDNSRGDLMFAYDYAGAALPPYVWGGPVAPVTFIPMVRKK